MVGQLLPGGGLQPSVQARHTQHGGTLQRRTQRSGDCSVVADQPDAVQPVFLAPQRLAQLPLKIQMLLAGCVAGATGYADQQPLPL